jgi:hypothetical protein
MAWDVCPLASEAPTEVLIELKLASKEYIPAEE